MRTCLRLRRPPSWPWSSSPPRSAKRRRADALGDPLPDGALMRSAPPAFASRFRPHGVRLSPDGKVIAVGDRPERGPLARRRRRFGNPPHRVSRSARRAIGFSPAGDLLAARSATPTTSGTWRRASPRPHRHETEPAFTTSLSADGKNPGRRAVPGPGRIRATSTRRQGDRLVRFGPISSPKSPSPRTAKVASRGRPLPERPATRRTGRSSAKMVQIWDRKLARSCGASKRTAGPSPRSPFRRTAKCWRWPPTRARSNFETG